MLPSRQKRSGWVFFLQASILQLNESMKLWTPFLLLSLTLRIRQPCWKISSTPSVYCKASISNEGGGKAPGQQAVGAGRGWALPQGLPQALPASSVTANTTVFLPPKNSPSCQSINSGYTHAWSQEKKKSPSAPLSPLLRAQKNEHLSKLIELPHISWAWVMAPRTHSQ